MEYDFDKEILRPEHKEAVRLCQQYEARQGIALTNVSENSDWFKRGADLYEETSDHPVLIDVKCLLTYHLYPIPSIPVEMMEIVGFDGYKKQGWLFSEIDYIYYVLWNTKKLIKIKRTDLIAKTYSQSWRGYASWHPKQKYFTLGILIPIEELKLPIVNLI